MIRAPIIVLAATVAIIAQTENPTLARVVRTGSPIVVSASGPEFSFRRSIATTGLSDEGFVVAWSREQARGVCRARETECLQDTDCESGRCSLYSDVYAQRIVGRDSAAEPELRVSEDNSSFNDAVALTTGSDNQFVVVWSTGYNGRTRGQRIKVNGGIEGAEFQVNEPNHGTGTGDVCTTTTGDFIVAWDALDRRTHGEGVWARRYDRSGSQLGPLITVAESEDNYSRDTTQITCNAQGFLVAWVERFYRGPEVRARHFFSDGAADGPSFRIDRGIGPIALTTTGDHQVAVSWYTSELDHPARILAQQFDIEPGPNCGADCDVDGAVRIDDLTLGVRIALGLDHQDICPLADIDDDGRIAVNDLVGAIEIAVHGCPGTPDRRRSVGP